MDTNKPGERLDNRDGTITGGRKGVAYLRDEFGAPPGAQRSDAAPAVPVSPRPRRKATFTPPV
jgi:hypothetical protein